MGNAETFKIERAVWGKVLDEKDVSDSRTREEGGTELVVRIEVEDFPALKIVIDGELRLGLGPWNEKSEGERGEDGRDPATVSQQECRGNGGEVGGIAIAVSEDATEQYAKPHQESRVPAAADQRESKRKQIEQPWEVVAELALLAGLDRSVEGVAEQFDAKVFGEEPIVVGEVLIEVPRKSQDQDDHAGFQPLAKGRTSPEKEGKGKDASEPLGHDGKTHEGTHESRGLGRSKNGKQVKEGEQIVHQEETSTGLP